MARPRGNVVAAADRKMREARERWLLRGEGTLAEFAEAMDEFTRWDELHGHTTSTGATGLPDLDEYPSDMARRSRADGQGGGVVAEGDAPELPVEAGRAPSAAIRGPLAGVGESTARPRDPVGWGACHGLPYLERGRR